MPRNCFSKLKTRRQGYSPSQKLEGWAGARGVFLLHLHQLEEYWPARKFLVYIMYMLTCFQCKLSFFLV